MVIKHLENKIRLVGIICTAFLAGCIIISVSSIWTARTMVTDAQKKVYVLDGNVPILVTRTTMDETLDVEAKSHVEMFHHYFLLSHRTTNTSAIRWKKRCTWSMRRDWHSTIPSRKRDFTPIYWVRAQCSRYSVTVSPLTKRIWSSPTMVGSESSAGVIS